MAKLRNYTQFAGRSPVSASISNALGYQGTIAPHSGKPFSEALLAGIAGGVCFGYFTFHYENHYPQINILTRNSFHNYGWDAIIERLGIHQDVVHSSHPQLAEEKLIAALAEGKVPIVFADVFTLGYEHSELGKGMWAMQPMVVIEYHPERNRVLVADRSVCAHSIPADVLQKARGRVKKTRYRMVLLSPPDNERLPAAVLAGMRETIALFTEKPPKGSASNFGFKAYDAIIRDLGSPAGKTSWVKKLLGGAKNLSSAGGIDPATASRSVAGGGLSAGLMTAYKYSQLFWKNAGEGGDRLLYSNFLDEAASILDNRSILKASALFREAASLWNALGDVLLPAEVPHLHHIRSLLLERNHLFVSRGSANIAKLESLDQALETAIRGSSLPTEEEIKALFSALAAQFREISQIEKQAVSALTQSLALSQARG